MMKSQLFIFYIFIFCGLFGMPTAKAQKTNHGFPVIGEQCPDFVLENVKNHTSGWISLADLKGRYVVLDFWHRYCSACIASFPKMNELAKQFEDSVEIIMVGLEDKIGLDNLYEELKNRHGLIMPLVSDSSLFNRFVPGKSAPHIILIDREGIVKAITGSLDYESLRAFSNDQNFDFHDLSFDARFNKHQDYDQNKLFLMDGNGGVGYDIRYRSLLVDYKRNIMPKKSFPASLDDVNRHGLRTIEGVTYLLFLYRMAYFGYGTWTSNLKIHPFYETLYKEPIWEIGDFSDFDPNYATGEKMYWYSLYLPEGKSNKENQMRAMQSDLKLNFGYDVSVEKRNMPYWKIVADRGVLDKLRAKGGDMRHYISNDATVQNFRNYPFDEFIRKVFGKVYQTTMPIINETDFHENIDIKFNDGVGTDMEVIKRELERHEIFLYKDEKPFSVLVIRPPAQD